MQNFMLTEPEAADPFSGYSIASHDPLIGLKRTKCKKCGCSRMFFCYKCHVYMDGIEESKLPTVKLPFKMDIIKHAKELDGKSTAIHAALLAPEDVQIYTYPTIPDYSKVSETLLVFPGKNASSMEDMFGKRTEVKDPGGSDGEPIAKRSRLETDAHVNSNGGNKDDCVSSKKDIKKVVFIDCTWNQAYGIFSDERIRRLPTVKLSEHKTVYWRHNEEMPYSFLATIEAIYHFFRLRNELVNGGYDGRYDNLLYFYSYFHKLVQEGMQKAKTKKLAS